MAKQFKQFKVLVNTGKETDVVSVDVPRSVGGKVTAVHIKAKAGAKYQLQELSNTAGGKALAPDYVKTRRVGKNLHILFEGDTEASVIIDDYYSEMPAGYNGVIGQAENGSFYEYTPEDPRSGGLVGNLVDGGEAINAALGGNQVQPAGAAVAALALGPLLGALGLTGAAAAAAAAGGGGTTATVTTTGALAPTSDTGAIGDGITKNVNPEMTGKTTPGAAVALDIKDATGKVIGTYTTTADANGNYMLIHRPN